MNTEDKKETPKINFQYLIPSKNAEKVDTYIEALEDAIEKEDINNIAISGSYGAGKSSFIKTFIDRKNNYNYLDISLATFEKNTKDMSLIEKSILQQMFYKVEQSEIPQSRFKRINTIQFLKTKAIVILLFILSALFISKSKYVPFLDFLNTQITFSETAYTSTFTLAIFKVIPISIVLIGIFFIIKSIIQNYSGLALEKLNLQNLEIKTNDDNESSLLNNYLDEILYFFSHTDYNIVIFQDLDRFKNVEIFTKLRELNNFLNNSKQVRNKHDKIVFLYAIKDSMFTNGDSRTKFFDFMIPIIPYINSSTSYEKLLEFFYTDLESFNNDDKKKFEEFLRDISLYINDMRLLKNIYNEFKIYDTKIGHQLDKIKLLAMIIYKNFYPEDFSDLHKNKGVFFNLFTNKNTHIKKVDNITNQEIFTLQEEIKTINESSEHINNINELRSLYILKIIENLPDGLYSNRYIKFPDGTYIIPKDAVNKENFQKLIKADALYGNSSYQSTTFEIAEESISELSYQDREDIILNKTTNKVKILEKKVIELREKQKMIYKSTLQELLSFPESADIFKDIITNHSDTLDTGNTQPKNLEAFYELLELLVINGHIDEDYYLYLSYSFNKSLTLQDTTFVKSVISNKLLDSSFKLTNLTEILNRLNITLFKKISILNYDLINFLIENKGNYKEQYETIFEQLSNESEESIGFIFSYLDSLPLVNNFIKEIVNSWDGFWIHIINNDFTNEKKEEYFYLLLYNAPVSTIKKLNKQDSLKRYIEDLTKLKDLVNVENNKFQKLITLLDINFYNLSEPITNIPLFSYIYENNHYKINELMIEQIFKVKFPNDYGLDSIDTLLESQNLSTIFLYHRETKKLSDYIKQNISSYVDNIILGRTDNILESGDTIVWLLNNDNLSKEQKFKIIESQENKLKEELNEIEDDEILNEVFNQNKVNPHWDNISHLYNKTKELNKVLIAYLSIKDNAKALSREKISTKYFEENETFDSKLLKDILTCNDIKTESYKLLVKSNGFWYADLDFCELGEDKIDILIEKGKLQLTIENIEKLLEFSLSKHIILIENLFDTFIEKYDDFSRLFSSDDYLKLFTSTKLTDKNKLTLLDIIDIDVLDINNELAVKLSSLYTNNNKWMGKELLEKIISILSSDESLAILVHQLTYSADELDCNEINELLDYLEKPYNEISKRTGSYIKISINENNKNLVRILDDKNCISSYSIGTFKIRVNRFRN